MNRIFQYGIQYILLILIQVLALSKLTALGIATPYIYPLFILTLPIYTPRFLTMILAFSMGLIIDAFSNTAGMHTFALVLLAYARPLLLRIMTPKDGYAPDDRPTIYGLGFTWFLIYGLIGITLHHTVFYIIEIFNFAYWNFILLRIA